MHKHIEQKSAGTSPGTLQYVGTERSHPVQIHAIRYNQESAQEFMLHHAGEIAPLRKAGSKLWIHVTGVYDAKLIEAIGKDFGIHSLVLEDILGTRQRPKAEDYGQFLFFVIRYVTLKDEEPEDEQISILVGSDYVISFQETENHLFSHISLRLLEMKGRLPILGTDYLTYRLLDSVVDSHHAFISALEDRVDDSEAELVKHHERFSVEMLFHLRQQTVALKKAATPLRDFVSFFRNTDSELISDELSIFLMDFGDHVTRTIETIESCRESISAMMELHVSQSDRRMNEVMKVLAVISTIFIPLSFLTGWFGMNFTGMRPEYDYEFAYPLFIAAIIIVVIAQLYYFRRRKWL